MSLSSSIQQFKRVNQQDRALTEAGARRGWYLYHFYLGRFRNKLGIASRETQGQFSIADKQLLVHIMPEQLSSLFGIFGDHEYDLRQLLPNEPRTILDLGANSGMATLYLHAHFPEAVFACVEPDPRNISLLEKTLKSNNLDARVTIIPAAVASKAGKLQLRMGANTTCSALETSPLHDLADSTSVEVTTVPRLLEQLGWDHIDLLKMDIEGTEDELLSTENDWLHRVGSMVLEIHPNTTPGKIQSYLAPFGFTLTPLNRGIEPVFFAGKSS